MTVSYQELLKSNCGSKSKFHVMESLSLNLKLTNDSSKPHQRSWGAVEALSSRQTIEDNEVYVHPLARRSLSSLSAESLEMCTESLGSETGTFISESTVFDQSLHSSYSNEENKDVKRNDQYYQHSINKMTKFPPPLTTMRGSNSIQVKSYREEGRLVIKAVLTPPQESCFKAERSGGRLKLSLVRGSSSENDDDEDIVEDGFSECVGHNGVEYEEKEEEYDDIVGIRIDLGVKMGMGNSKLNQWLTRCKESGMGVNWESFWVKLLEPFVIVF